MSQGQRKRGEKGRNHFIEGKKNLPNPEERNKGECELMRRADERRGEREDKVKARIKNPTKNKKKTDWGTSRTTGGALGGG